MLELQQTQDAPRTSTRGWPCKTALQNRASMSAIETEYETHDSFTVAVVF